MTRGAAQRNPPQKCHHPLPSPANSRGRGHKSNARGEEQLSETAKRVLLLGFVLEWLGVFDQHAAGRLGMEKADHPGQALARHLID